MIQLTRIPHYAKRIVELGATKSLGVLANKIKSAYHGLKLRRAAYNGTASFTWEDIAHNHNYPYSFSDFYSGLQSRPAQLGHMTYMPYFEQSVADEFLHKKFDILGSGPSSFKQVPWHEDIRLAAMNNQSNVHFNNHVFHKDIVINAGETDQLVKDIKVPWELSRSHYLLVLAQAYEVTKDEKYAQAIQEHIASWIQENPYLLGVNWACAMDVGLRALNWIAVWKYIKHSPSILPSFQESFVCSLYDHMVYLEQNWEIYDYKTSNHYLSDLVGYLYLCYFFSELQGMPAKAYWCYREILAEFDKQVHPDGTDYEGSTRYHGLVTELFFHAYILFKELKFPVHDNFYPKLRSMFSFIKWAYPHAIGDNDSGKVLYYGLSSNILDALQPQERYHGTKHWPNFGLSIHKAQDMYISLRHHVYSNRQPSGHFHNDAGSIIVSYKNIPIIVDPGSFVYTPSTIWRNYFRSVEQHSTFYIQDHEPVSFNDHLFSLDIPEQQWNVAFQPYHGLYTHHSLYARFGVQAHRHIDIKQNHITLTDWWQKIANNDNPISTVWNFTFAPGIELEFQDHVWRISHQGQLLMTLESELRFEKRQGWFSPEYGVKQECWQLKTRNQVNCDQKMMIAFKLV